MSGAHEVTYAPISATRTPTNAATRPSPMAPNTTHPNERTIFKAILLMAIGFSYVSPMANSLCSKRLLLREPAPSMPACWRHPWKILPSERLWWALRRVASFTSADDPCACQRQGIQDIALGGRAPNPVASVFLETQVDAGLSTITGECSRSSCRLKSKRCSRPSEMGYTRSG